LSGKQGEKKKKKNIKGIQSEDSGNIHSYPTLIIYFFTRLLPSFYLCEALRIDKKLRAW
jgi:hypothetical protein